MDFASPAVREQAKALIEWTTNRDRFATLHELKTVLARHGFEGGNLELRAMGIGGSFEGGEAVHNGLIPSFYTALDATNVVRRHATLLTTEKGGRHDVPIIETTAVDGSLIDENVEMASEDIACGEKSVGAHKYGSKPAKMSVELWTDGGPSMLATVGRVLGKRIGRITNKHFTTGTGSGQPLGIVPGSSLGVTAAATGAVTYSELVNLQDSVAEEYQQNGRWMMSRATFGVVKKLLDSAGQPLWQPWGDGGYLLGKPVVLNKDMPAIGAGNKPIIYGDLSCYLVREVQGLTIRSFGERFAEYFQAAMSAVLRCDGILLDANGVKHLVMAAS